MATSVERDERLILQRLRDRYEHEGYSFHVYPPREVVPSFLGNYQPDAIALREGRGIIIEVKNVGSSAVERRLAQIAKLIEGQEGWRFEIVSVDGSRSEHQIKIFPGAMIRAELSEVDRLAKEGHSRSALVLAWAVIEATARALLSGIVDEPRPMMPATVTELLAQHGLLDQQSAKILRNLIRSRNSVVHGDLGQNIDEQELTTLIGIARKLVDQLLVDH